jgi:glycosyltransferase involved in cell wall biosynthesis
VRILQIAPIDRRVPPYRYGAIERIVHLLTEGLVRRGHRVTLLASGNSITSAELQPIIARPLCDDSYCQDLKIREAHFTIALAKILNLVRDRHFDVIHNHLGWRLLPFWRSIADPFVTTIQTPLDSPSKDAAFEEAGPTPIVSISDSQRLARPDLNYVATVPNGIDLSLYNLSTEHKGYLMFLGRMAPEKGAVEAIMIAKALRKPLIMAAAVHAWERQYFIEKVLPLIDDSGIRFIGEIDDIEKNELLGGAEALLNPIQWDEPFGIACIEAMACGTPIVTLRRGAMPEVVLDSVTGLVGSSIEELIERFGEIKSLDRSVCRAHVGSKFSSEAMIENYLKVYSRILSSRTARD